MDDAMTAVEAVIVAGGLGTRLLPLTEHRPKHLLPVGGVPFVAHQLAKLGGAGIGRVVLATSYYADMFEPTLGDGSAWGVELVYVREEIPLGTAGAIRSAATFLESAPDDPVVILNGDILSSHDLSAQLDHHRSAGADVTLHLVAVDDARAYGCVPTDDDGTVIAFVEKSPNPISNQINAGCYIFTRKVIDAIPVGQVVSVERETFPALVEGAGRVVGWVDAGYWLDVGTPAALVKASADVVRGIATSPATEQPPAEAWVHATASLRGSAVARGGSAIGPDAVLEDGVVVEGSVVDEGATIGTGSQIMSSAIGAGAVLGADVVLRDAVIGDGAVIGAGCELVNGVRIPGGTRLPAGTHRFS
jgi:mannose-1-phosphate guanylyltransferase